MGKRPWSSGIRSDGLATWKAPAPMNSTWSVLTGPYFVVTVVPSTIGRRSRWTPSRDTSGPWPPSRPATLSISSRKTMPACSTRSRASSATSWRSISASASCRLRISRASLTLDHLAFAFAEQAGEHLLQVESHRLDALGRDHLELLGRRLVHLDLDHAVVQPALLEPLAEAFAGLGGRGLVGGVAGLAGRLGRLGNEDPEQPLVGPGRGVGLDRGPLLLADHRHRELHQVADDRLDVAADVADLGELARLDLEERGAGEPGQPAGDLRLADAGGPHHQDVLGRNVLGGFGIDLLAPPPVAHGDRHRALGVLLADDVAVERGDDLARREVLDERGVRRRGQRHASLPAASRRSTTISSFV